MSCCRAKSVNEVNKADISAKEVLASGAQRAACLILKMLSVKNLKKLRR